MFPKPFAAIFRHPVTLALACATLAAACGYRGPLYLPDEQPPRAGASADSADSGLVAEDDEFGQEQLDEDEFEDNLEDEFDEDEFEDDGLPSPGDKG